MRHAFVTGYPITHSRSPLIHGHWLERYGIEGSYQAVEVAPDDLEAFVTGLRGGSAGFVGGNVTIPHKEAVLALADEPDALAERLGAANTLSVEKGRVRATNTDGYGFLANLDQAAPGWAKGGSRAVVLGAGGASRAILDALIGRGFGEIIIVNRTRSRAETLASHFGADAVSVAEMDDLEQVLTGASFFVNTSSMGMKGEEVPAIPFEKMAEGAVVNDIVYTPLETPILAQAARAGCRTVDGLGMLLHQAVPGFELWFGRRPEVTAELRDLVVADLEKAP